jgi:tetratricopeptide (TPR) repeat protein
MNKIKITKHISLAPKQILKIAFAATLIFNTPIIEPLVYAQKGGVVFESETKKTPDPKATKPAPPRPKRDKNKIKTDNTTEVVETEMIPPVENLPVKNKRYALVIGIDKYDNQEIIKLDGAVNDARTLAAALQVYANFPGEQVTILSPDQSADYKPTRQNIIKWITRLSKSAGKDGLLFISFSGHAVEINKEAFLLASDSEISDSVTAMGQSGIKIDSIKDIVQENGTSQIMLVLDACRNDPRKSSKTDNLLSESYFKGFDFYSKEKGVTASATLYATSPGGRSYEDTEKKQGYFTTALIEGLRGKAANQRGEITLDSLETYVQDRVINLTEGKNVSQVPQFRYKGYTDNVVLSYLPNSSIAARDATSSADLLTVAKTAFESKDYSKATEVYKTILLVNPEPEAYLNLGQIYLEQSKFEDSLKLFSELVKLEPENANAFYFMGKAYSQLNNDKDAIESWKNATNLKDKLSQGYLADTFLNLGSTYLKIGNYQDSMSALQQATTVKADYPENVYYQLAEASRLAGSYKDAITAYNKAISLPGATYGIGLCYVALGAEGKTQAKQYLEQAKTAAKASFKQGEDFRKASNLQAATDAYLQAIKIYPEDEASYLQLGYCYLQLGNKESARKQYDALVKIKSNKATELLKELNKAK